MPDAGSDITPSTPLKGDVRQPLPHDSAIKHVTGAAAYIDDIPEPRNLLHIYLAQSPYAHAKIVRMDLSPVRAAPGVVAVLSAEDVPGLNDVGPVISDDPIFADGVVQFVGQSLFAVAAETLAAARAAANLAEIEYEALEPILTIGAARAAGATIEAPQTMTLGDAAAEIAKAPRAVSGDIAIGAQDHFYLEGQVALVIPKEDGDMLVYSSTQNPTETQHLVARALGRPDNSVTVETRRMGGGFGGKETQSALLAAAAALVANVTGRPAKLRFDRDDDMVMTGKRHPFEVRYEVGYDDDGVLRGARFDLASNCGYSTDLSMAINDRAMFHSDNAYFLNAAEIVSHRLRTHTVSNTAFRGFGGPQGMVAIERAMDEIGFALGKDPLDVRLANLYGGAGRDVTPYHQTVEDCVAADIMETLAETSSYRVRRAEIADFNKTSAVLKRGIALTPVKFGISFTTTHLNQAGALVHVYSDGSVHLNHGGTEMGQGLMIKVAQVVANEFQVDVDRIKVTATTTDKVPNTSATAASSGSDLNGMAAQAAARTIKERLQAFAAEQFDCGAEEVRFADNAVWGAGRSMAFNELVKKAYLARVSLSSTGFYKTPKIHYDRKAHRGRPFYYFAYGAAASEVLVDTLTGEYRVERVDILHDVGKSLNPAIDLGQIEGGFIQGMGWLTTEEVCFDDKGRLTTHAPSTYKIPTCSDRPRTFNIKIWEKGENREPTIHRSKAVGEPPFMLAISVFSALTEAVASVSGGRAFPALDAPATPERVLTAVDAMKAAAAGSA
ncbi:MAG: xanthine dehydrogenase molybdopterin binding subunit [Pseudomonadota bacterium]